MIVALLLCLVGVLSAQDLGTQRDNEVQYQSSTLQNIFSDYDADRRPPAEKESVPAIFVSVSAHILDVNYDSGWATLNMYFRQRWLDSRLSLPVNDDGTTVRQLARGVLVPNNRQIWTPNTYFVHGSMINKDSKQTIIEEDGRIFYSQHVTVKVRAKRNLASGKIEVDLQIGSYLYDFSDVTYIWQHGDSINGPALANYDKFDTCSDQADGIIGGYSCIRATLQLNDGNCFALLVRYGLSSVTLVIISLLHFWLPSSWTVARPLSALLPALIFATLMLAGLVDLHSCSEIIWWIICLGVTFASTLEYYFVACCHSWSTNIKYETPEKQPLTSSVGRHSSAPLDISCRIILPLVFFVLLIAFLILFIFAF